MSDEHVEVTWPPIDVLMSPEAGTTAARGAVIQASAYLIGTLISALGVAMLFRHLGVVETGRYVTAMSLVAIVGALSDLGLTAVGIRELSRLPPNKREPLTRDLLGLRLILTLVGGTVVTMITWIAYSGELAAGVALASTGLLFQATQDNFVLTLYVGLRLGRVSLLNVSRQLLTTLFIVVLVLLGASLVPFLSVSIPVGILVVSLTMLCVPRNRAMTPTFNWGRWKALLSPMLPYSAAVAASAFYYRVSLFMVSGISSESQLGYFSASFRILEALMVVPPLLVNSVLPILARAAKDDTERFAYGLRSVFYVSVNAGAWVAVSVAVGAPLAVSLIGGPSFEHAVPVLALQGVGLGAMFVSVVWAYGLLNLGMYRTMLIVNASALGFNAILVAPLALNYGARGAALGTGITEIVVGICEAAVLVHHRPELRPSLKVLPRVALATGAGLAPLALTGIPDIARLFISSAAFAAVALVIRSLPRELVTLLPTRRRK